MPPLTYPDKKILIDALGDAPAFLTTRGRHAMVRDAFSGYDDQGESATKLRFLNWEGGPDLVASELVHRLDGSSFADGVPALALLAQAAERVTGATHRDRIADLRRRQGWGVTEVALPADVPWRDRRNAETIHQERIIGEDTLRPMYYLRRALEVADAVVRVDRQGKPEGTGFMVTPDLLITNAHVIPNEAAAQEASACFFEELADPQNTSLLRRQPFRAATTPSGALVFTHQTLDISILRLAAAPELRRYPALQPKKLEAGARVAIIQHPGGYPKQISLQNNQVAYGNERILQYYTSTNGGSSGSPVFDSDFAVVAIHHGWVEAPQGAGPVDYRNQGTSVFALLEKLKEAAPGIWRELMPNGAGGHQ